MIFYRKTIDFKTYNWLIWYFYAKKIQNKKNKYKFDSLIRSR